MKNYYEILGLDPKCKIDDIKKAYRRLVKKFHPDCSEENGDCSKFRDIQEAYDTLVEDYSRNDYDAILNDFEANNIPVQIHKKKRPNNSETNGYDFQKDIFEDVTNFFNESNTYQTNELELLLSESEAKKGGIFRIEIPVKKVCPYCHGFGNGFLLYCDYCNGKGEIKEMLNFKLEVPKNVANNSIYRLNIHDDYYLDLTIKIHGNTV